MQKSTYGCFIKKKYGLKLLIAGSLLILLAAGCGGGGGDSSTNDQSNNNNAASQTAFPSSLAVASPLNLDSDTGAGTAGTQSRGLTIRAVTASEIGSQYEAAIATINTILEGTSTSSCTFNPELFFQTVTNASCYGPSVQYEDHPDDVSTPNSGELPPGDVGIWLEVDQTTGDACAAAELNARMEGIQARALGALSGMAAMVCTIYTSGGTLSMPDAANTIVDLTSDIPQPAGVVVTSAILAYGTTSDGEDKYSYILDFDYGTDQINVALVHIPSATATNVYRGQLSYQISTTTNGSNCPMVSGSTPVTRNGSLVYNRTSASAMTIEMREGQFCGADINGLNSDQIVDATRKFDPTAEPNGWGDDFNLFRADFDPTTQLGDFAYSWQAGHHDGNTRVFNLVVYDDGDAATEDLEATAFFGYGNDAENADPNISGFIFNWAGPGNNHTLQEFAQEQTMSFNTGTGKFDSDTAKISYAPTTSGAYDGTGTFTYDSDADGTVDTNPAVAITVDLAVSSDDGTGTFTIEQTIIDAGITVPVQPACTECTY